MAYSPTPVNDAVSRIVELNKPVLFVDTCSLLDIVRLPARQGAPGKPHQQLPAATSILSSLRMSQISLVAPFLVGDEYTSNLPATEDLTRRQLQRLQEDYDLTSAIEVARGGSLPAVSIPQEEIVNYLSNLATQLLDEAVHLGEDDEASNRATSRAISCTPPANKGTIKDCVIYEHAIKVMKLVRQAGHNSNLVFLTSNTKDFCEGTMPRQPIKGELELLCAALCTHWSWALAELAK